MLELRRARLDAGGRPVGWKTGFGSSAAFAQLGTTAALVGFLTDHTLVEPGSEVSLAGWTKPVLEPEIAVYVDADGALREVGLAIELVDFDPPPDDPESILGRNIYHRGVVLGPERGPLRDLRARVYRNGELVAETDDVGALNGDPAAAARLVAETVGAELRAGQVVIAGSIVPPIAVAPGERYRYELDPLGSLELSFAS
jgi:2-keto-4-pentenoate hydratase